MNPQYDQSIDWAGEIQRWNKTKRLDASEFYLVSTSYSVLSNCFCAAAFLVAGNQYYFRKVRKRYYQRLNPAHQARTRERNMRPEVKAKRHALERQRRASVEHAERYREEKIYERRRNLPAETKARNREWLRQWMNEKRRTDPQYNLGNRLRSRIWHALDGAKKSAKTAELVGCTLAELKAHLERQFKPGMNWSNRSEWHIDHRRPIASFDLTDPEQQRQCFHYSNLQPLWKAENQSKSAKWDSSETLVSA